MRWVNRGPAPSGLKLFRDQFTRGWTSHYRDHFGARPTDARWREFRDELSSRFHGACGYCEEAGRGEVDHFRPKSKYPELVYEWSNWVFACHTCNAIYKKDKWPAGGYVDPCARSRRARPEKFFDFTLRTAEIVTKSGLSQGRLRKARKTIHDIELKDRSHIEKRLARVELVRKLLSFLAATPIPSVEQCMRQLADPPHELSSITRAVLVKNGYPVEQS